MRDALPVLLFTFAAVVVIAAFTVVARLAFRAEPPAAVVCPEPLPLSWYAPGGLDTGRVPVPSSTADRQRPTP